MGKYHLTYKILTETKNESQKAAYWKMGLGLNKIDNLTPSAYLMDKLLPENIKGNLGYQEIESSLVDYYEKIKEDDPQIQAEKECDFVSTRIANLLDNSGFSFSPATLKGIHRHLFKGILPKDWVGIFREKNIYKPEPILNGDSVSYGNYFMIKDTLDYDFEQEKEKNYSKMTTDQMVKNISNFTSSIWQVHPFREGNTRTTAVFICQYLITLGFDINNTPFEESALYFRNALVRSNYANLEKEITSTNGYLEKFFNKLLKNENHRLSELEFDFENFQGMSEK